MEIEDLPQQEPAQSQVLQSGEEQAKSVDAFVKDKSINVFGKEFLPLFSKHLVLSFFDKSEVGLLMQLFDNALLSQMVNRDISEEELLKYNQMRIVFFSVLKRAVGKGDNERTLLGKTITESIIGGGSQSGNTFLQRFFGIRKGGR